MKQLNGLPVFQMTIDEFDTQTGVEFISLVDYPAIEVNWVAFSNKQPKKFAFNKDKQLVTGPAMIPDLPIYRSDDVNGDYYVTFTADEIEKIARKFSREQRTLGINYQHQDNSQVKDAVITEYWFIADKNNDKSNSFGFDLPVGTWMVTTYLADTKFWNDEVKSGNVKGYSIEGFLNMEMSKSINKNKIKNQMTKIKMKAEIKTVDGAVLSTPADSFIEGSEVYMIDGDGNEVPAADGDYVLENGSTITVLAGKITAVVTPEAESTDVALELTPEDTDAIVAALQPMFDAINARLDALEAANTAMATENLELRTAMSKLPGAPALTTKTDDNKTVSKTKMSLQDKLEKLRSLKK